MVIHSIELPSPPGEPDRESGRCRHWVDSIENPDDGRPSIYPGIAGAAPKALNDAGTIKAAKVISKPAQRLLMELNTAKSTGGYYRLLESILKRDLLVLDDFGLQALPSPAIQDLYKIIGERYGVRIFRYLALQTVSHP
jgi:hypothetical protein